MGRGRRKRRGLLKRIGRGLKKAGKRVLGSSLASVASSLIPGGGLVTQGVNVVRGLRRPSSRPSATPSMQLSPTGLAPAQTASIRPGQALTPVPTSEQGVVSDIFRDISGFTSFLRSKGEGAGLQMLTQFISTGGASLPSQLAGLWGEYVAAKNAVTPGTGLVDPVVVPPPTGGGGGGAVVPSGGGGDVALYNQLYMPIMMKPTPKVINSAPRGYVIVEHPVTKEKIAVLKEVARKLKLWSPAPKPPITASEYRMLKKAERVEKKLVNLNRRIGYVVRPKKTA